MSVVDTNLLECIPCESQCIKYLSELVKREESDKSNFHYMRLPFGLIDANGLRPLRRVFEEMHFITNELNEKAWFEKLMLIPMEQISNICSTVRCYFINNVWANGVSNTTMYGDYRSNMIRGFCEEKWLTEYQITGIFDIINDTCLNSICFVSHPDSRVTCSNSNVIRKIRSFKQNLGSLKQIFIAMNVGKNDINQTVVNDGVHNCNHWALLVIDIESKTCRYCDSLAWTIPVNLHNIIPNHLRIINDELNTNIKQCLQNIILMNSAIHQHTYNHFKYPIQTCGHICGVICVLYSIVWSHVKMGVVYDEFIKCLLSDPSKNSDYFRLILINCLLNNNLNLAPKSVANVVHAHTGPSEVHNPTSTCFEVPADLESNEPTTTVTIPKKKIDKQPLTADLEYDSMDQEYFLSTLPHNYEYQITGLEYDESRENVKAIFDINISKELDIKEWITEFNKKTKQTMVIERTRKGKRVLCKLYLKCHHNQRRTGSHALKEKSLKTTYKGHSDKNTSCPTTLIATVMANKDCVTMQLNACHNHPIEAADALRFRPISDETRHRYYELFRLGHSPSSAFSEYETVLMMQNDTIQAYSLADRSTNPKLNDVYNMFSKWRKNNLGIKNGKEMFDELEKKINMYNSENDTIGGKAVMQRFIKGNDGTLDQPLIVAIVTPLMSRVHEFVKQSGELVFIDSSASFDDFNNPIFILSTASPAGGLPLGIVITSGESTATVKDGLLMLQGMLLSSKAFGGEGNISGPKTIVTDDSTAEREGIQQVWPHSQLYLCIFHLLQSVWRWLLSRKNNINSDDRQYLMKLFRKVVYSENEETFEKSYVQLLNDDIALKYSNFLSYISSYYARKKEWGICYRNRLLARGNYTNNYAEAGIKILKDVVFKRTKAYNLVQLFDYMTVTFEIYYERRLLAVAHNRLDRYIALRFKGLGGQAVNTNDILKSNEGDHIYIVKSQSYENMEYTVNTNSGHCTCTVGFTGSPTGELCKHQAAVAKKYNLDLPNMIPYFSTEGRYLYAILALGKKNAGDQSFYVDILGKTKLKAHVNADDTKSDSTSCDVITENDALCNINDETIAIDNIDLVSQESTVSQESSTCSNLQMHVTDLMTDFVKDASSRILSNDIQYLTGLQKFLEHYATIVNKTEPNASATPILSNFLHNITKQDKPVDKICKPVCLVGGVRRMSVQPTAISRRRLDLPKGSQKVSAGRPPLK